MTKNWNCFSLGGLGCRQPIRDCCLGEVNHKEAANHSRAARTSLVDENEAYQSAYPKLRTNSIQG